jgi:hypothetical protein
LGDGCAARISRETSKALFGHANVDITTHYSAAELGELLAAAEKITDRGKTQSPTLMVIRCTAEKDVGKRRRINRPRPVIL